MSTARVVLRGAQTYKLGGLSWLKDNPKTIKGEDKIRAFEQNGYFHVKRLASKSPSPTISSAKEAPSRKFVKRTLPAEETESKEE